MKQVLVIEDDKMIRTLCSRMLQSNGWSVEAKATPLEAIEYSQANKNTIDLIVSDYSLPDKNGYDLVMDLINDQEAAKVILISGLWEEETLDTVTAQGFDYMTKPFYPRDLLAKVKNLFEH